MQINDWPTPTPFTTFLIYNCRLGHLLKLSRFFVAFQQTLVRNTHFTCKLSPTCAPILRATDTGVTLVKEDGFVEFLTHHVTDAKGSTDRKYGSSRKHTARTSENTDDTVEQLVFQSRCTCTRNSQNRMPLWAQKWHHCESDFSHIRNFCFVIPVFNYSYFRNRAANVDGICNTDINHIVINMAIVLYN